MRGLVVAVCVACACGRIGFDPAAGDAGDAAGDAVEPIGQLDPTFGTGGYTLTPPAMPSYAAFDIVERTQGGYLLVGPHTIGGSAFGLFAFATNGTLDTSFGTNGIADIGPTGSDFGYGAVRLADRRILLAGDGNAGTATVDDFTLGIVDEAGVPDPAFGTNGFARIDVGGNRLPDTCAHAVQIGTTLVTCGTSNYPAADSHIALVALSLAGAPLASFGTGGQVVVDFHPATDDSCHDLIGLPDGTIVAVGGTASNGLVAAYKLDGTLHPTFAGGAPLEYPSAYFMDISLAPDGDLIVSGNVNGIGVVGKLSPAGVPRAGFGQNGFAALPMALTLVENLVQPDGKVVVVGQTQAMNPLMARLRVDGTLDVTFGNGGIIELALGAPGVLLGIILTSDGKLVAAGFVGAAEPYRAAVVRLQ